MTKPLQLIFAGTPEFAALHLTALIEQGYDIIAVYTQPDRPAGRGKKLTSSPVKTVALEHDIPVYQPESLKSEAAQAELRALNPDLLVVVAYGLILPQAVLDIPRYGCFNVHGSLLPRWRGAAPIQRACWAGDTETGVTIMQMDAGLDSGAMLRKATCPILAEDTSGSLYQKLATLGPIALIETIEDLKQNRLQPQEQEATQVTHAAKLSKEEALLDWTLSAAQLERCVRAFNPWPMAHFTHQGESFKVWTAHIQPSTQTAAPGTILQIDKTGLHVMTSDGILIITRFQPSGKKPMAVADYLNAKSDFFTVGHLI